MAHDQARELLAKELDEGERQLTRLRVGSHGESATPTSERCGVCVESEVSVGGGRERD